ncbi:unnamed protein product [Enterobius vermicularis]|uniref:Uncharacterized protein n=1 Tax=Enterobius vermicularis TaxID=51028 RepID=A0A0N4UVB1_ENTVE|nr:unnamed protein product [Enterobius vermicularis]
MHFGEEREKAEERVGFPLLNADLEVSFGAEDCELACCVTVVGSIPSKYPGLSLRSLTVFQQLRDNSVCVLLKLQMDCLSNFGHQGLFQKLTLPYEELEAFFQLLEVRMPVDDQIALDMRRQNGSTISSATIFSYFKPFRDVCISYFNAHSVKLGGPG